MHIIKKTIKWIIRTTYHVMQEHYLTFRLLVWLKEMGVTRRINFLISHDKDEYERLHPTEDMKKSQDFFRENADRVDRVLSLFADEQSRKVMRAVLDYRMYRIPISRELYSEHDQYFTDCINLQDGEVFVDGGAYTGDTVQQLLDTARKRKIRIKRIEAFEPDDNNYKVLSRFFQGKRGITIHKMGLSDKANTLYFKNNGESARIVNNPQDATDRIDVIKIDDVEGCQAATFIKMDIEGAEWDALHGAKRIITHNVPKLAICVYHSDEDVLRLAELIHFFVPEYSLYLRHHSRSDVETVLYAIYEKRITS